MSNQYDAIVIGTELAATSPLELFEVLAPMTRGVVRPRPEPLSTGEVLPC